MTSTGAGTSSSAQDDALHRRRLNVVGHELRTPVSTLAGLAARLADADLEEIRSELGPAIHRLALRTERLLDDLLVGTDVTTALPVESAEPVDLGEAAVAAWSRMGGSSALQVEGAATALVGREAADRAITHLLRNAATYGGDVRVELRSDGDQSVLAVSNGGVAAGAFDIELIFDAFYRGEHAVTAAPGLGLGLPVARQLIRRHGGDVTAQLDGTGTFVAELRVPRP